MRSLENIFKINHNEAETVISLVGIGTGAANQFTKDAIDACLEADLLIGAGRMLEAVDEMLKECLVQAIHHQDRLKEYRPDQIISFLRSHPEYRRIVVALSGDVGFYSGSKKLYLAIRADKILNERSFEVKMIPGISSVVYLASKIGISWEDAAFASVHGRKQNVIGIVREHAKTFVLAGAGSSVRELAEQLVEYGFGSLKIYAGFFLSYKAEEILEFTAKELRNYKEQDLAVLCICNPNAEKVQTAPFFSDNLFIRGKVPMTKEEVRTVSLSKMRLKRNSVVYDIGAGTGSVSVEAAYLAKNGRVYAVECNPEGAILIRENAKKFQVENISVIDGMAPDSLDALPAPDVVFIGGSKGQLREILQVVQVKNPRARVVINAITLETLTRALDLCREMDIVDDEIVELQVSKAKNIGSYHMMTGQNPIYIISFTLNGNG